MYELIEHKKLDSAAASITFSNIPQIYTDLVVLLSGRGSSTEGSGGAVYNVRFNGSTTNYSGRRLAGNGSSAFSSADFFLPMSASDYTANTFGNSQIYIPNYRSAVAKSWSGDSVGENNATSSLQFIVAGLWNDANPINSVQLIPNIGNFVQHSSATLYGINRTQAIGRPKAIGGNITYANGYWVHTFTGSGSFYAQEDLEVDALVVAGGGGGGGAGGGGAGGFRVTSAALSSGAYPVLVGSGGVGSSSWTTYDQQSGVSSSFIIESAGGGFGGSADSLMNGAPGGSGGGGGMTTNSIGSPRAGSAGNTPAVTPSQGNSGGAGLYSGTPLYGGGGGGAGAAGSNQTGGAGALWDGSYYAGGGGGGHRSSTPGAGGIGGGGAGTGSKGIAGTANTGGGGGGGGLVTAPYGGGNGGSGVVIVRYKG